ncbi:Uncharacterized protein GBIM_06022 [Gryllus bimaculatus]|nr:Uncharacterized protein GBIM_06022 [Gryllus bimaculatus]
MKALLCEEDDTKVEEVHDSSYAQCPFNPKALANLCECDVHRETKPGETCPMAEDPYCRGCQVAFPPQMLGPCEKIFVAEDVRAADITAAHFEVEKPSDTTLVIKQTCTECCKEAVDTEICCTDEPTLEPEEELPSEESLDSKEITEIIQGSTSEKPSKEVEKVDEAPPQPREWFTFGKDLFYFEPIIIRNPPVRYDTTSCISGAWDTYTATPPHPPIRYDTTSSLTGAYQDLARYMWPPHPPVRYDTTSCLSPAFEGALPPLPELLRNPPVRYDNTGCLSSAFNHPPCRYDNTGKLSSYYISDEPPDFIHLLPALPATKAPKSTHLLEYKPLMSYDVGPDWTLLELHELLKKPDRMKTCKKPPIKRLPLPTCPPKITQFPTVRRGHKRCLDVQFRVPSRMGWLWNTSACGLPYRPGWRPGAIMRAVSIKIHNFHKAYGVDTAPASKKRREKSADDGQKELPPTLESPYAPPATRTVSTEVRPYSVDLTVSKSTSSLSSSGSSLRAHGDFSESSGFSSSAPRSSLYSGSSVCPPCVCSGSEDTDSLKIEFVAPANFQPRWKFPSMHHEETLVTAEELLAARKKSKLKKPEEPPPEEPKGKKSKGGKEKKGKGKKGKKGKK